MSQNPGGRKHESERNIAEKIRASICKKPFHAGNKELDISASIGITSAIPAGNKKDMIHLLEDMIEKANSALYRPKMREETG